MEPLPAIGLARSLIQLVDYASTLSTRIGELSSAVGKAPSKIDAR